MFRLLKKLFPINRSLTGNGVRTTLKILKDENNEIIIRAEPSGKKIYDWTIPNEWNVSEAYIIKPNGEKICEYSKNNLHLLGYSIPINKVMTLQELQKHLYSLPELPDAIPYLTSYYDEDWGFCIADIERNKLPEGDYTVVINSSLEPGFINYADAYIPSSTITKEEIFFSTNICHPSLANNELSGPVLASRLCNWIKKMNHRNYNYRFAFLPETIGSLIYLNKNLKSLKKNVLAGFNLTCVGDDSQFSFLPSRTGKTFADKVAIHVLKYHTDEFIKYSFLQRGSDERQYCSPNADLPFVSICRSKYHTYKEYHTSLDNLDFVSENGLNGSLEIYKKVIICIENNHKYCSKIIGEPFLRKRNMYSKIGFRENQKFSDLILNVLAYCDGANDVVDIANTLNLSFIEILPIINILINEDLIELIN